MKTMILLTNLGTPDAPTPKALRRYLAEFLSDRRVVELPRWLWLPILYGVILPTRPKKSAKLYQSIWNEQGSPLLSITQKQCQALQMLLQNNADIEVAYAMRYGAPNITQVLQPYEKAALQRIIVLPLYPQYSSTTTGSTFDAISSVLNTWRYVPELTFISHYHTHEGYIQALAESIITHCQTHERPQKLLFSFHGLPKLMAEKGDPYPKLCQATAQAVADTLKWQDHGWQLVFQSRFGPTPWLEPYCDQTLMTLPKQGIKHVAVICPGFAADCLETLEEIDKTNRELFMKAGGETFHYIPALNDHPAHIKVLKQLVQDAIGRHSNQDIE